MAIGLTALGLLAFLLGCSGTFVEPQNSERTAKCSLTGRWVNDRGAKIVISHNINGVFSGVYVAAPSATNKTIPPLMLQGIQHLDPQPTFGFILKSNISASSTVFVGQCFIDENGEEHLKTAWLLRRNLPSPAETWKATSSPAQPPYFYGAKRPPGCLLRPSTRPAALLLPTKEDSFLVTWMELLQGRPPKTEENSPSLLWVSVLPLIRRGLQCVVGDLAGPVRP
ncbi:avidin-like isoform X2 [Crotalus tigris]|uniref:avidin-like isoform X2 n=1 Tax=Crotalus tigris TaxID=88082 RepID=UPI00192F2E12|nr:avidin-like isoform X2 [Crotalus tigris]